jgi:hypothetical protein
MPALIEPSPITATTLLSRPSRRGGGEAEGGRDRGRGVGRAERVVVALRPLGAGQAAALAQGADAVAAAGQDLVRIGLMADVPDQDVLRGFIDVVQGDRQLDHPQARAQVAAGDRNRVDRLGPQLVGQLPQLGDREAPGVRGRLHGVEKRRGWRHTVDVLFLAAAL